MISATEATNNGEMKELTNDFVSIKGNHVQHEFAWALPDHNLFGQHVL
jgi:hypothetical protein